MKREEQLAGTNPRTSLWRFLKWVHQDENGGVSIETVLIIAAIALPILIFLLRVGWPAIKSWYIALMGELGIEVEDRAPR